VFVTYFRILKIASKSVLLSPVLEGLAKFAHLINVDFFHDLLNVLKQISLEQYQNYLDVKGNHSAETKNALHCVIAAFQLLSGQGEALNIDLKDFYSSLYTQMMRIPLSTESCRVEQEAAGPGGEMSHMAVLRHSDIHLLLQGFELVFFKKKQLPIQRVAAFVKRLATISLQLSSNALLACLAMIRSLMIRFPKLDILFDVESRMGTGVYRPYLDDLELANANATNLWEMSQLTMHYHPRVRDFAKHLLEMSTEKYQNGARRGIDPNLTLRSMDYLEKYESVKGDRFTVYPPTQVPGVVKQFVKRKNRSGFKRIDGPTFLKESDFVSKLYQNLESE
jgi:nucleolar complex protein 3